MIAISLLGADNGAQVRRAGLETALSLTRIIGDIKHQTEENKE